MIRLLLVDDEEKVVEGLQRRLRLHLRDYDISIAFSGPQALEILEKNNIDIIVSDLRMPEMDGAEFFQIVQEKHPQIIRFILSGHSEKDLFVTSSLFIHQHLSKPCEAARLAGIIKETIESLESLAQQEVKKTISQITQLPELPKTYQKLNVALQTNGETNETVSSLIEKEPALVARIMKISNSAFFGVGGQISSIEEALTLLGLDMIRGLVLLHDLTQILQVPKSSGLDTEILWCHSINTSLVAKEMGRKNQLSANVIEEAYTVALLHDLGKLILAHVYDQEYQEALTTSREQRIPLWKIEKDLFGNCHAEVGAHLLQLWGLPKTFVEAIKFHHCPHRKSSGASMATELVHLSDYLENRRGSQSIFFTTGTADTESLRCLKYLGENEEVNL